MGVLLRLHCRHHGRPSLGALAIEGDDVAACSNRRDQFSEFFDHGRELDRGGDPGRRGCHMSSFDDKSLVRPLIISISRLKEVSMKVMEIRLAEWIKKLGDGKIQGGSVASLQLRSDDVSRAIDGDDMCTLCITGKLSAFQKSPEVFCLEDFNCCCPTTTYEAFALPECFTFQNVICNLKVCVVSALCLGVSSAGQVRNGCNLEPWTDLEQTAKEGSCALLDFNGYIFILSIHVHCDSIVSTLLQPSVAPTSFKQRPPYTIEQMLDPQQVIQDDTVFSGILCRHRLKFTKVKSGQFQGTTLTLAHCSNIEKQLIDSSALSTLQSLELKIVTSIPEERKARLMRSVQCLTSMSSGSLLDEQCCLAAAWWKMADGASSALIACGIDETLKAEHGSHNSFASRFVPQIVVPTSSLSHGSFGFARFTCDIADIRVRLVEVRNLDLPAGNTSTANLTSLGNQTFSRGMLDRLSTGSWSMKGEQRSIQLLGMQSVALGALHQDICEDIRMRSQSRLAPSMVRLVRAARFLAVSYCKVHVQCSRCHSSLVRITKGDLSQLSGVSECAPHRHFWGLPTVKGSAHKRCRLKCPSHCPSECFEVVWECSGLLDDGSGQCQLYAERETALALLGIEPENTITIEAGAWETEFGICFRKTSPPSIFLKHAIRDAQASLASRASGRKVTVKEVLDTLTPKARALYLLHQVCAKAPNALRELDYVIRCKPLSTDAFRLNRTEVKISDSQLMPIDTVVYSLPPLKLIMVSMLPK